MGLKQDVFTLAGVWRLEKGAADIVDIIPSITLNIFASSPDGLDQISYI
jgi:hypothetical protein